MINIDEIRKEIAVKHDTLLGEDDPVLMLATMFDSLLAQSVNTLNEQQQANLRALINAVQQSLAETKATASKVVTQGTEYACDQISTAITVTMDEGREELRKDIRYAWERVDSARKVAVFSAAVSGFCAVVVLATVLV